MTSRTDSHQTGSGTTPTPAPPPSLTRRLTLLATLLTLSVFYLWSAQNPSDGYAFNRESFAYYHLLTDGFRSGTLAMKYDPHPDLLALENPYDPAQTAPKLHDASFYRGRYYLYFGAAPAVALYLPFKVLTGFHFPQNLGIAFFAIVGLVGNVVLIRGLIRRYFPNCWTTTYAGLAVLLLGAANFAPLVLRRPGVWEVPIAGAFAFSSWAFVCAFRALIAKEDGRKTAMLGALVGMSLLWGLAVGSRPGYIFGAPALIVIVWAALPSRNIRRWETWKSAVPAMLAGFLPLTLAVGIILLYNHLRFENPFEFGTTWQLAGHDMSKWKMLDAANIPINAYYYLLSPAQWTTFFPFVEVIRGAPFKNPPGYYGIENPYGILPNLPFVLFAIVAVVWALRGGWKSVPTLAAVIGLFFLILAGSLHVLLRYAAANGRYLLDLLPPLLLTALLGWAIAEAGVCRRASLRWLIRALAVTLIAVSSIVGVLIGLSHNSLLEKLEPKTFGSLARVFNRASPVLEKLSGSTHYGAIDLEVRLPKDRQGKIEPLVVTGLAFKADYVFIFYPDDKHIQLGFEHTSAGGFMTQPIYVNYDWTIPIRIELGSLYPPETHPYFKGADPASVWDLKRTLRFWVNGIPYAEKRASFYESSPKDVTIGRDDLFSAFGPRFSGDILTVRRSLTEPPRERLEGNGPLQLALQFPSDRTGHHEPLLVTGKTGRGDILYVSYVDADHVRFSIDHWGYGEVRSELVKIDYARIHILEIDVGSLYPNPPGSVEPIGTKRAYRILLNGFSVLEGQTHFHPAERDQIYVGTNPIGGSSAQENFTGRIHTRARRDP